MYLFGKCDICGGTQDGFAEVVGCVSRGIALWVFCPVEYIQRKEVDLDVLHITVIGVPWMRFTNLANVGPRQHVSRT